MREILHQLPGMSKRSSIDSMTMDNRSMSYDQYESQNLNRCIPKGSLSQWVDRFYHDRLLSPHDLLYLLQQAADALQYAHNAQIMHLDVKPSNFLLRQQKTGTRPPSLSVLNRLWHLSLSYLDGDGQPADSWHAFVDGSRAMDQCSSSRSNPVRVPHLFVLAPHSGHFLDWKLDFGERVVKIFSPAQATLAAWSNDGAGIVFHSGSQCVIGRKRQRWMATMERTGYVGKSWQLAACQPSLTVYGKPIGSPASNWRDNLHGTWSTFVITLRMNDEQMIDEFDSIALQQSIDPAYLIRQIVRRWVQRDPCDWPGCFEHDFVGWQQTALLQGAQAYFDAHELLLFRLDLLLELCPSESQHPLQYARRNARRQNLSDLCKSQSRLFFRVIEKPHTHQRDRFVTTVPPCAIMQV